MFRRLRSLLRRRPKKEYACSICGRSFGTPEARDDHLATEHELGDMYGR